MIARLQRGCKRAAIALVLGLFAAAAQAGADEVAAEVDAFNVRIISLLQEQRDSGNLNEQSALEIIRAEAASHFDFEAITRSAVGKHWRKADDGERTSLTELFSDLLEKTYSRTLAKFNGQEMRLSDSAEREPGVYAVRFVVTHEGKEFKIEYLAHEKDGGWLIYDIKVEGVSLIASYRNQFSQVIRKQGIAGLLDMLRERT